MEEPIIQSFVSEPHDHALLYTAIGMSVGSIAILIVVAVSLLVKRPLSPTSQALLPSQNTAVQNQVTSVKKQVQQVTPVPIQSKQDLQAIAQKLDATSLTQISSGLNQNTQDLSNFGQ
ncbi:MAG TPA: hypothetical protein VFQ63_00220 [Patescibacteria group bacterium]|nr:hypothetical protein [Patescibacteria group bacterium]